MNSYKLVPSPDPKVASLQETAGSLGLHDTLQHGPRSIAAEIDSSSPAAALKARVENWEQTQDALKLTAQRNIYGLHMPARRLMERRIVMESHLPAHMHPLGARQANLAMDILMGRDETVDLADVFDGVEMREPVDNRKEMEKKLKL